MIDPIDGTKNFSRGLPVWATTIALERDGEYVCDGAAPRAGEQVVSSNGPLHESLLALLVGRS